MNATELFEHLASIEGSRDAGSQGNGVVRTRLLSGVEYAQVGDAAERKMRAQWKRRSKGGPTPLLVIADDPEGGGRLKVLGPQGDGPLRTVRAESLRDLVERTVEMGSLEAVRHIAEEVERLDSARTVGISPLTPQESR